MIIVTLILLGLCLGSFVNALVWRIHEQSKVGKKAAGDLSITRGRSICTDCKHTLHAKDLIPVFSWLALRGKCRYCKEPIAWQYPAVEVSTATLFVFAYIVWPEDLYGLGIAQFGAWLIVLAGFMALVIYDLRWMLLPNRIVFPLYGVAAFIVAAEAAKQQSLTPLLGALGGILVGGGIFYLLFRLSNEKWIGGGDVKLGFLLGALLMSPLNAGLMLFIASLLGTAVSLPLLFTGKAGKSTRIPFGPFLIAGAVVVQLFGDGIIEWYLNQVITL